MAALDSDKNPLGPRIPALERVVFYYFNQNQEPGNPEPEIQALQVSGEAVEMDVHEYGSYILNSYLHKPPAPGIWIWEGHVVEVAALEERDVIYKGQFRRPSAEELAKIAMGTRLWPLATPNPGVPEIPEEQDPLEP